MKQADHINSKQEIYTFCFCLCAALVVTILFVPEWQIFTMDINPSLSFPSTPPPESQIAQIENAGYDYSGKANIYIWNEENEIYIRINPSTERFKVCSQDFDVIQKDYDFLITLRTSWGTFSCDSLTEARTFLLDPFEWSNTFDRFAPFIITFDGGYKEIQKIEYTPTNYPPYMPSNPSPPNAAINISNKPILSWSSGDPDSEDSVTYDIYFSTSSKPIIAALNQNTAKYSPGSLQYSTVYYWKIRAIDNRSNTIEGPVWSFTTIGPPPKASAGSDQIVTTGTIVTLDGRESSDPGGDTLTYQWVIIDKPQGSNVALSNNTANISFFTPDTDGVYKIQLIVNDGATDSEPDTVSTRSLGRKEKIAIVTTATKYRAGDKLTLCIWVGNSYTSEEIIADGFIGFGTPDGHLLFMDSAFNLQISNSSDSKTFVPFVQGIKIPSGFIFPGRNEVNIDTDGNGKNDGYILYRRAISQEWLPGQYFVFAALAEPGSIQSGNPKIIGNISISEFSIVK